MNFLNKFRMIVNKIFQIQNLLLIFIFNCVEGVARFAIKSVGTRSVVIEMVDAQNVSRFDMRVLIYDLEKLREFRRSELTGARYNAQLFSFDGLIPGNWFAFRIEYRLIYDQQMWKKVRSSSIEDGQKDGMKHREHFLAKDLSTKQELVVRTRPEIKASGKTLPISGEHLPPMGMDIEDELVQFNRVQLFPDLHQLNLTLIPVLNNRERISTLVVAELRCARGTVKPQAQQVPDKGTILSFDLKRIHPGPLSLSNALSRLKCKDLCIFPFIRIEPPAQQSSSSSSDEENNKRKNSPAHRQTFRAREICESLEENEPSSPSATSFAASSMAERKWPAAATDELQQKLLDRHFRSSTSSANSSLRIISSQTILLMIFSIIFLLKYFHHNHS